MKVVSRYCDSCGIKIPATDIKDEYALEFEGSYFCRDCRDEILPIIERSRKKSKLRKSGSDTRLARKKGVRKSTKGTIKAATKVVGAEEYSGKKSGVRSRPKRKSAGKPFSVKKKRSAAGIKIPKRKPPLKDRDRRADVESTEDGEEGPRFQRRKKSKVIPASIIGGGTLILIIIAGYMWHDNNIRQEEQVIRAQAVIDSKKEVFDRAKAVADAALGWAKENGSKFDEARARLLVARDLANDVNYVGADFRSVLKSLKDGRRDAARKAFEDMQVKSDILLSDGKVDEAMKVFEDFPAALRNTDWWKRSAQDELKKLHHIVSAQQEAKSLIEASRKFSDDNKWDRARGILQGYSERHEGTKWYRKIRAELSGIEVKEADQAELTAQADEAAIKAQEEKEERERLAAEWKELVTKAKEKPWTPLVGSDKAGTLILWQMGNAGTWEVPSSGMFEGTSTGTEAWRGFNKPYRNFMVEFKYKVLRGGFKVALRVQGSAMGGSGARPNATLVDPSISGKADADGFTHVQILVLEEKVYRLGDNLENLDSHEELTPTSTVSAYAGGFGFLLDASSKVQWKDVQIKALKVVNK